MTQFCSLSEIPGAQARGMTMTKTRIAPHWAELVEAAREAEKVHA